MSIRVPPRWNRRPVDSRRPLHSLTVALQRDPLPLRRLPGQQKCLDQLALAAHRHSGRALVPTAGAGDFGSAPTIDRHPAPESFFSDNAAAALICHTIPRQTRCPESFTVSTTWGTLCGSRQWSTGAGLRTSVRTPPSGRADSPWPSGSPRSTNSRNWAGRCSDARWSTTPGRGAPGPAA